MVDEQNCRICDGELKIVLDLGEIYPSTFLREDEKISEDAKAPLVLAECKECRLVQLKHTIDLDLMYRQYWYNSSLNKSMVSSLKDIVAEIESKVTLEFGDKVLDIGCNDGALLGLYSNSELMKVGYDPALNTQRTGEFKLINDYFSADSFTGRKAKAITAIAMLYDLPDPNKFVEDVKQVLADDGIFVIQLTDLMSMFKVCAFDSICHEHLEYYKLSDVINLLRKHELDVIDVSYNDVNGGSVRITACHEGAYLPKPSVVSSIVDEREFFKTNTIDTFKKCIDTTKMKVQTFLKWAEGHGHRVYLLGASTKGNSLLQICGVTCEQIPFAAEVNKEKFGLRTVGSNIRIISEEEALIKHPDYFIVAIWHFRDSILRNPKMLDYLKSNGRLIFPLPTLSVFTKTGGFML